MAKHIETGKLGEKMAVLFLKTKGYQILETNWRFEKCEIDIIAQKSGLIVFVEVKTRSTNFFGYPEEYVDKNKQRLMSKAASAYLEANCEDCEMRFDVISITLPKKTHPEIRHIEDAFFLYDEP